MGTFERARERGTRMGIATRRRVGDQSRIARIEAGLSQRALGDLVKLSHSTIGRMERGDVRRLTIERVAQVSAVLGLELRVTFFPAGSPVRDKGHLALIKRLRLRVSRSLRWRTEVPTPINGDLRAADVVIDRAEFGILVEAETRLSDVQALERRVRTKQRDMRLARVILLIADTRHNRSVLDAHPELAEQFPVSTRVCMLALRDGRDPGGDAIVLI